MKRLLALLLTAGLTIGLTGCGPEQGEHSSQESSGVESSRPELSLPEQSYESVEEVPDFYVQVLMMYGAAEDPETQELHPLHVSLFYGGEGGALCLPAGGKPGLVLPRRGTGEHHVRLVRGRDPGTVPSGFQLL